MEYKLDENRTLGGGGGVFVHVCPAAVLRVSKQCLALERHSIHIYGINDYTPPKMWAQFSSVAQSYPTLCNPMNRSTPGLPVHHQLPEFITTESVMPSNHLTLCRWLLKTYG